MPRTEPLNTITREVIGSAIEVHRALGPGLLESAYVACLCHELILCSVPFERERAIPIRYKGHALDCGYRVDLVVATSVLVEVKAIERVTAVHQAQLLTYLRLLSQPIGLLINFNVRSLRSGISRMVNGFHSASSVSSVVS
jgi:GxxExxY protein